MGKPLKMSRPGYSQDHDPDSDFRYPNRRKPMECGETEQLMRRAFPSKHVTGFRPHEICQQNSNHDRLGSPLNRADGLSV